MLYTLVGNGTANKREVLASIDSLRSAVEKPDEFWMAFLDQEPSETVAAIVAGLDTQGIYYEVVVGDGDETHEVFTKADAVHFARRPLDLLIKLTKGRVQPGEASAILVLSDDLDNDTNALYAIERAVAEGLPVYDLGGQMVQILLEEDEPGPTSQVTDEDAVAAGTTKEDLATAIAESREIERESDAGVPDPEPTSLETPSAEDFTLPDENGAAVTPPTYTRYDLEDLTRDELKSLVKTVGVINCDLRSKPSMIDALLKHQEGGAEPEEPGARLDAFGLPAGEWDGSEAVDVAQGPRVAEQADIDLALPPVSADPLSPPVGVFNILVVHEDRTISVVPVPEALGPVILSILEQS